MALPPCVLLDRYVTFLDDPAEQASGAGTEEGEEEQAEEAVGGRCVAGEVPSHEALSERIAAYLRAMRPDARVLDPPWVTYLSMVRPAQSDDSVPQFGRWIDSGVVATAHRNLVVLYAGPYRPASSSEGCYLIYDAAAAGNNNSPCLSTVPAIPFSPSCTSPGRGTVVAAGADGGGVVFLAELLIKLPRRPAAGFQGVLFVWSPPQNRWVQKAGRLPAEVSPPVHVFKAHMSFSFENLLCWVDLLHGLLICDDMERRLQLHNSGEIEFRFVALPHGCCSAKTNRRKQRLPREFRSMGCVDGAIKLVNIDGYKERSTPAKEVTLTTWTLDVHNLSNPSWTQDTKLHLRDLWADESFASRGLPQIKPMLPVLDTRQHDVVYLVFADVEPVASGNWKVRRVRQLISVDMRSKKVLSSKNYNSPGRVWPNLFVCEFSAHLHGLKDNQRGLEPIEVKESAKRMKL